MISKFSLGKNLKILSKKSYLAYIKPMGGWFFALLFILITDVSLLMKIILTVIILYLALGTFFYIKSYTLFIDDAGIWVYKGINSWNRGIYGVKWQDFGKAEYENNFNSWLTKSYYIVIKNKYKNEPEIELDDMLNGDIAVSEINSLSVKYMKGLT